MAGEIPSGMIAAVLLHPLIAILVAVLIGLIVVYCVSLFIPDQKILTVVKIIVGLIILVYALSLFGVTF